MQDILNKLKTIGEGIYSQKFLPEVEKLQREVGQSLQGIDTSAALEQLRVALLGKKGEFTQLLRGMGKLTAEERPTIGAAINSARESVEIALNARAAQISRIERAKRLKNERIDVTAPGNPREIGAIHPIYTVLSDILDIFVGLGFEVVEGPEIELERYNFELLNIPKNHPARDMQDTIYVEDGVVLRTHTSPVQARTMTTRKPPIRIVCPGRTYRSDEVDATHSPVFHQMEALVVDEGIAMSDLKGTLDAFAKGLYGEGIATRFRPSFFPFTEPSAEVDVSCVYCMGKGCRVCKGTGWIELLGSGMVNPKVLDACGIDSTKYSGFALGMGIERVAMIKYGINDMRLFWENDLRFLRQFH